MINNLKSLKILKKIKKFKGYVFDLRNNPGGLLTQAINITDFFLEDGEIVSTKGRNVSKQENSLLEKVMKLRVNQL